MLYRGWVLPGFNIPNIKPCDSEIPNSDLYYNSPSHLAEFERSHRYLVEFNVNALTARPSLNNIGIYCFKCSRPAPETDVITVHQGAYELKIPGKSRWKPVECSFYEDDCSVVGRSTVGQVTRWLKIWYDVIHYERDRNLLSRRTVGTIKISQLNGLGAPSRRSNLYYAWPSTINPSELSYTNNDVSVISVTFQYSHCVYGVNDGADAEDE